MKTPTESPARGCRWYVYAMWPEVGPAEVCCDHCIDATTCLNCEEYEVGG